MIPRIAITPGEPAGIGPELIVKLAQTAHPAELVVIADPDLLKERALLLQLPLTLIPYDSTVKPVAQQAQTITLLSEKLPTSSIAGQLNAKNAEYVLNTLERATQGCLDKEFDALVTGPIHKGILNEKIPFSGHTEWLAERAGNVPVVMMLATKDLRVALATTHIPLRDVADAISYEKLLETIRILHHALQNEFHIENPHILVAGLNPHAGEQGYLGYEELDIIIPALETLRAQGFSLEGPLPADTLFTPKYLKNADAVLAMYHDQGLPVLKYQGFGQAVNITLGLPFLRTSVDHGTALDIAGSGVAGVTSFEAAVDMVIRMLKD